MVGVAPSATRYRLDRWHRFSSSMMQRLAFDVAVLAARGERAVA
jgi:hypothetical protein